MKNVQKFITEVTKMVEEKREEYGPVDDIFCSFLQIMYPNGIAPEQYDDAIYSLRIMEKLGRVCSKNIPPEIKNDAYQDIVGYGLLGLNLDEEKKKEAIDPEESQKNEAEDNYGPIETS